MPERVRLVLGVGLHHTIRNLNAAYTADGGSFTTTSERVRSLDDRDTLMLSKLVQIRWAPCVQIRSRRIDL